jgi:hypothetical protein
LSFVRRLAAAAHAGPGVIGQPSETVAEPPSPKAVVQPSAAAVFAAQILGQDGQKRGLRGGSETLEKARATYLGAEWSGQADRRPKAGKITKTEI